jgi:hypothetical protein
MGWTISDLAEIRDKNKSFKIGRVVALRRSRACFLLALYRLATSGDGFIKLEATVAGWPLFRLLRSSAPHSGQCLQLPLNGNLRNAQFLPTLARSRPELLA